MRRGFKRMQIVAKISHNHEGVSARMHACARPQMLIEIAISPGSGTAFGPDDCAQPTCPRPGPIGFTRSNTTGSG
jgi:hypothetical protein